MWRSYLSVGGWPTPSCAPKAWRPAWRRYPLKSPLP